MTYLASLLSAVLSGLAHGFMYVGHLVYGVALAVAYRPLVALAILAVLAVLRLVVEIVDKRSAR